MEANSTRPGFEPLVPGSHVLRPLALYPVESPLVPEGFVAIASVQRSEEYLGQQVALSPAQTVAQLYALAEEIACLARRAIEEQPKHDLQK